MADRGLLFEFDVAGDKEVSRGLSRFGQYASDLTDPFNQIADDFWKIERGQFASEGSQGGAVWKPLNKDYAKRKALIFGVQPIMVASGKLRESLTAQTGYTIREINKQSFRLGTSIPYAAYHQQPSAMKGGGKMPRRPLIKLRESDKKRWIKIIQSYLVYREREAMRGY